LSLVRGLLNLFVLALVLSLGLPSSSFVRLESGRLGIARDDRAAELGVQLRSQVAKIVFKLSVPSPAATRAPEQFRGSDVRGLWLDTPVALAGRVLDRRTTIRGLRPRGHLPPRSADAAPA
jgi:hypothetical protein